MSGGLESVHASFSSIVLDTVSKVFPGNLLLLSSETLSEDNGDRLDRKTETTVSQSDHPEACCVDVFRK